jgi:hypothetical protein
MSNSSQQQTSLDDLLKDITIDLSEPTTTVIGSSDYSYSSDSTTMSTITISPQYNFNTTFANNSVNTISIDSSSLFTYNMPKEWIDCFPEWRRVEDMCKEYPGLEIAFRNFQTVYQLVKDDYDNPTPKK